jgi:hypothetical protein
MIKAVNDCLSSEDISWSTCVSICTDGAVALTGHKKGFKAEVTQVSLHINFIHCITHRHALACDLWPQSYIALQEAIKDTDYAKACHFNSYLFAVLGKETRTYHKSLLLHLKVWWLSRKKFLNN